MGSYGKCRKCGKDSPTAQDGCEGCGSPGTIYCMSYDLIAEDCSQCGGRELSCRKRVAPHTHVDSLPDGVKHKHLEHAETCKEDPSLCGSCMENIPGHDIFSEYRLSRECAKVAEARVEELEERLSEKACAHSDMAEMYRETRAELEALQGRHMRRIRSYDELAEAKAEMRAKFESRIQVLEGRASSHSSLTRAEEDRIAEVMHLLPSIMYDTPTSGTRSWGRVRILSDEIESILPFASIGNLQKITKVMLLAIRQGGALMDTTIETVALRTMECDGLQKERDEARGECATLAEEMRRGLEM